MRTLIALCVAALFPVFVVGQTEIEIEDTQAVNDALRALYKSLDQQEIRIEGAIGSLFGDQLYFSDGNGRFKVELDAGRDVRRQIEGCKLSLRATDSPCQLRGMAEVRVDDEDSDIGDGIEIELILYSVESFSKKNK